MYLMRYLFFLILLVLSNPLSSKTEKSSFETGFNFFEAKKYDEAKLQFEKSLKESESLKTYAHYYLASIEVEKGREAQAKKILSEILSEKPRPSGELKNRSLYLLARIHQNNGDWKEARWVLSGLSRNWRSSPHYPEVLYQLVRAESKMKRSRSACVFARKLYSSYPQHELLQDWGVDLRTNKVYGEPVRCTADIGDVNRRMRRLQLSGMAERARAEVLDLRQTLKGDDLLELDLAYSRFLVNEGMIDEALELLKKQSKDQKNNFDYLMRLAFAAARGGEARMAIGAYEKAHNLRPRSRDGREALFHAAFLSYQFQDYDGAIRKFSELVKEYPTSGLARDAKWHLAWLHYLRSDFKGAIEKFEEARLENRRRRRGGSSYLEEKLLYWKAMAQLRLDQTKEAKEGFIKIIQEQPYSFYSLLSRARLEQFASSIKDSEKGDRIPAVFAWREFSGDKDPVNMEEEESEEKLAEAKKEAEEDPVEPEEMFKDSTSIERLQAAKALMDVGQEEWARWELYEIERRSRSSQVRKQLISLYEKLGAYHRSARISELYFGMERHKQGLKGAEGLWKSMYPKAYEKTVRSEASRQGIPKEWVWAIMRAESLFRPDVISPVGAKGLMQIMPYTGTNLAKLRGEENFEVGDLFSPETNIALGSQYLGRLGRILANSFPVVAASYNAGPHRVKGWLMNFGHLEVDEFIEHIPFVETRNYVKRVLSNQFYYQALYENNTRPDKWLIQPLGVPIPQKLTARENWEAL